MLEKRVFKISKISSVEQETRVSSDDYMLGSCILSCQRTLRRCIRTPANEFIKSRINKVLFKPKNDSQTDLNELGFETNFLAAL